MKVIVSTFIGFLGGAAVAFWCFAKLFTHSLEDGLAEFLLQCSAFTAIVGAVVGAIAGCRWKVPLAISTLPLTGVIVLFVLGGIESGFQKNARALASLGILVCVMGGSTFVAGWITHRLRKNP